MMRFRVNDFRRVLYLFFLCFATGFSVIFDTVLGCHHILWLFSPESTSRSFAFVQNGAESVKKSHFY